MNELALAFAFVAAALLAGIAALTLRAMRLAPTAPDRLVAELRLAQIASLVLALTAGVSIGLIVNQGERSGLVRELALGLAFFTAASIAPFRDPREALTILAVAFGAHAVADVLHRPGLLVDGVAPQWYIVGCALLDLGLGAFCYLPVLRR
jgi:hypothetical protein